MSKVVRIGKGKVGGCFYINKFSKEKIYATGSSDLIIVRLKVLQSYCAASVSEHFVKYFVSLAFLYLI
jgi:hypothetical protein